MGEAVRPGRTMVGCELYGVKSGLRAVCSAVVLVAGSDAAGVAVWLAAGVGRVSVIWPQAASNRAETRGSRRMRMMVLSMMNGWVSGSLIIGGQEAT